MNEEKEEEVVKDPNPNTIDEPLIKAKLPGYLAESFGELYQEDGLMVLGRGLGTLMLIASFIRFYNDTKEGYVATIQETRAEEQIQNHNAYRKNRPPLVFVIGLKENERTSIIDTLESWGTPPEMLPTLVTNETVQAKDRAAIYLKGGVFIITSRILIVDLLTKVADPSYIDGILVAHAENCTPESTDAFILRIYRTQKYFNSNTNDGDETTENSSAGFVKAFSDNPAAITAGFSKVDKILKCLFVRKLYLYPRFHESVCLELNNQTLGNHRPPKVIEIQQPLTPLMRQIQNAIAAIVLACLRELKKATTFVNWADLGVDLKTLVSTHNNNFDFVISRKLDQDWHRLKPNTKGLVHDLRTLKTMFQYLIEYDCVSFWRFLQNIKSISAQSRQQSMWLLTPAADLLFRKAKERVYLLTLPPSSSSVRRDTSNSTSKAAAKSTVGKITPVLEENPKFQLLAKILTEIYDQNNSDDKNETPKASTILVMVKDYRTLNLLRQYLVQGGKRTMLIRWLRYLENFNDRSRAVTVTDKGTDGISEESRLLLEEENRARSIVSRNSNKSNKNNGFEESPEKRRMQKGEKCVQMARKRRRIETERHRGDGRLEEDDIAKRAILDDAIAHTQMDMEDEDEDKNMMDANMKNIESTVTYDSSSEESSLEDDELPYKVRMLPSPRIVFRTYTSIEGEQTQLLLQDLKPSHVILYDADISFIRSLEIYSSICSTTTNQLTVFLLLFEASYEQKNFLSSIEREKTAFEKLITHKKNLVVPLNIMGNMTQEMQLAKSNNSGIVGSYSNGTLPLSVDTRTGKGRQKVDAKNRRDIAVDVREFRSALPSILHQGNMRIAPVTLYVGDYILSPVHCIERKSISDLFGSFASGRLYTQSEAMCKYYKCPCLLIEFDTSKSFALLSSSEIGSDIRNDSIISKMVLLTLHFPKLRILWCYGDYETLKLFKLLKQNHEEVDVEKAMEIGSNESLDALLGIGNKKTENDDNKKKNDSKEDQDEINEVARDMLMRLPGINNNVENARKIMSACDNIQEVSEMSRDALRKLIGPINGQKLFTFFRQKIG